MTSRLVICASPRAMGKSARVSKGVFDLFRSCFPEDDANLLRLADLSIAPCIGCNTCKATGECFMDDGMGEVFSALDLSDDVTVVSPVYFAGPPANYKAMLDRFQPRFWSWELGQPKRRLRLVVLGDGGDPNGYEPLVVCTRSAFAVAGFRLEEIFPYIGMKADAVLEEFRRTLAGEAG